MANKKVFGSRGAAKLPRADTTNEAGGKAYALPPKHALAQYAVTGCLNATYYSSASMQLETVLGLCKELTSEYIAKVAVYAREKGYMKDMPALLVAVLAARKESDLVRRIFPRVIDNAKMLRNFVQIVRSGATTRVAFIQCARREVRQWLENQSAENLLYASVGNDPSLGDIIRMFHPRPRTPEQSDLFRYFLGKEKKEKLPDIVEHLESFRSGKTEVLPKTNFELLAGLEVMKDRHWVDMAKNMTWTQTRIHLNMLQKRGVFKDPAMVQMVVDRLKNPELIEKARAFPYQLLMAYVYTQSETLIANRIPDAVTRALKEAMELSTKNVPTTPGVRARLCLDVSGSMSSPVTGDRGAATSQATCLHVASLICSVYLRKNPDTVILPFAERLKSVKLDSDDTIMTNADKLLSLGGGGTDCHLPLEYLNKEKDKGDLVMYVSDNQSWMDRGYGGATGMAGEWKKYRERNPKAKLVCIDLQANGSVQAPDKIGDTLNIGGGFDDHCFEVINAFVNGDLERGSWTTEIEKSSI